MLGRVAIEWHAACGPACTCARRSAGGALLAQEVTLPDGSKFKIFDMCAVKIWVDTHENHRESLKIELIDRSLVPRDDLVS